MQKYKYAELARTSKTYTSITLQLLVLKENSRRRTVARSAAGLENHSSSREYEFETSPKGKNQYHRKSFSLLDDFFLE